jgi:hypothetical protein
MIILAIKLTNDTQLFAEAQDDTEDYLYVRDVIGVKELIKEQSDGSHYVSNIPYLYFPYNSSQVLRLSKKDILFYDTVDEYTMFYYDSVYRDLVTDENKKRKWIMQLAVADMEDSPHRTDDEPSEDEISPDEYYTVDQLQELKLEPEDNEYYYSTGADKEKKITIH